MDDYQDFLKIRKLAFEIIELGYERDLCLSKLYLHHDREMTFGRYKNKDKISDKIVSSFLNLSDDNRARLFLNMFHWLRNKHNETDYETAELCNEFYLKTTGRYEEIQRLLQRDKEIV